jgi:membrane protein YdbS with pleckstrin-like domain
VLRADVEDHVGGRQATGSDTDVQGLHSGGVHVVSLPRVRAILAAMSGQSSGARHAEPFEPLGVVWSRVSGRLAAARRVTCCSTVGVILIAVLAAAWLSDHSWSYLAALPLAVLGAWAWWVIGRQVAAIGYAEQEDDLLVRRGVLWRQIVVVPYGRLQYVEVQAGPVDRLFGISRVQLHTASAGTDAVIPGLPPPEAARLRDRLTERGQARLAGL